MWPTGRQGQDLTLKDIFFWGKENIEIEIKSPQRKNYQECAFNIPRNAC